MIKTTLRLRDFLALFPRTSPIVRIIGAYIGVSLFDLAFDTQIFPIVALLAVLYAIGTVAAHGDIEIFNRVRDSIALTRMLGRRDSRVLRTLRRLSKEGRYAAVGYLACVGIETNRRRNLSIYIDLSTHSGRENHDVFEFLIADGDHQGLFRGIAVIDRNGIAPIAFRLNGAEVRPVLKVLGPVQYFEIRLPDTDDEDEESAPDLHNPFTRMAVSFLKEQCPTKADVARLRRKIAKEIHPDFGAPDERSCRSAALAWANDQLDRREAGLA